MRPEAMTVEQLAGQRLMVGFEGTGFDRDLELLIRTLKVGGIILFARNIASPEQIRELCRSAQECALSCGQPPLLISVDQEGGTVARLREPHFTRFPGNSAVSDEADAAHFARVTAQELSGVGINMDLAPVLDVIPPGLSSVMAARCFPGGPQRVADLGTAVIHHLQKAGMMSVAKHFPGIGRTVIDSHLDLPDLDVPVEEMAETDLLPFQAAIRCGVAGIMLSHIRYTRVDPEWPASLSVEIARNLLRERIGFSGVVMTDDLDMGAVEKHYPFADAVRQAVSAEIDIMLICRRSGKMETAFDQLAGMISASAAEKVQAMASAQRILRLKRRFGLFAA